jgi:hypothetical protein
VLGVAAQSVVLFLLVSHNHSPVPEIVVPGTAITVPLCAGRTQRQPGISD